MRLRGSRGGMKRTKWGPKFRDARTLRLRICPFRQGSPFAAAQKLAILPRYQTKIMKKLLFVFCVLTSISISGVSQNTSGGGFVQGIFSRLSFGLQAGVNYNNYTHTDFTTNALLGFHAGGLVNFKISNQFSIQEEFLFSSQGAKIKGDEFGKENISVYYMTVPFLLKYRSPFGLYVEAGPQTGLRIKDDAEVSNGDFAKRLDLAAVGGLGYQTKGGFGIGLRYVAGLSKVGDFNLSSVHTDFKTNVVQASIFYLF
jgi:hypothetical protein